VLMYCSNNGLVRPILKSLNLSSSLTTS